MSEHPFITSEATGQSSLKSRLKTSPLKLSIPTIFNGNNHLIQQPRSADPTDRNFTKPRKFSKGINDLPLINNNFMKKNFNMGEEHDMGGFDSDDEYFVTTPGSRMSTPSIKGKLIFEMLWVFFWYYLKMLPNFHCDSLSQQTS